MGIGDAAKAALSKALEALQAIAEVRAIDVVEVGA